MTKDELALPPTLPLSVLNCYLMADPGWVAKNTPSSTSWVSWVSWAQCQVHRLSGSHSLAPKHELVLPPTHHHGFR